MLINAERHNAKNIAFIGDLSASCINFTKTGMSPVPPKRVPQPHRNTTMPAKIATIIVNINVFAQVFAIRVV